MVIMIDFSNFEIFDPPRLFENLEREFNGER